MSQQLLKQCLANVSCKLPFDSWTCEDLQTCGGVPVAIHDHVAPHIVAYVSLRLAGVCTMEIEVYSTGSTGSGRRLLLNLAARLGAWAGIGWAGRNWPA